MTGPDTTDTIEAPPCPPAVVEDMFRVFDKAVKARQLYMPNNPTYQKALANAKAAIEPLWDQMGSLVLQVTDTQLKWYGKVVNEHPEKSGDSLPWLLFKDGLRELALFPGFEDEELERFLALIPRVRHAQPHEDDLLTILWEQDFQCLKYRYVEINDPAAPLESMEATPGRWPAPEGKAHEPTTEAIDEAKDVQDGAESGEEQPKRPGVISMEDFDASLYFLDPNEIEYLRTETEREYALDLRRLTLQALLDIFELQVDPLVRGEVVGDIEVLVLHMLTAQQYSTVAYLLKEVEGTLQRAREVRAEERERLGKLADRLSNPDVLGQMLQALEESSQLPNKDDLAQLFGQLKPAALGTLLDQIDRTQNSGLRPLLETSAERLAQSNTGELVRLVKDAKTSVAREAIRRAGAMKTAAAVPALGEVLGSGVERPVRSAAVTALNDIGTPGAMSALETALSDDDRDIRLATVRALMARTHRPALQKVQALVTGAHAKDIDRTERIALFELYGSICGDAGVKILDPILNAKSGLFGRKEDPELRACAAVALGKINTDASRAALQKSAAEKDVIVRNAVSRALRGGGAS
ncbi:MAG: HEAT repeat domain-containing protein [Gemmatimonadaceae bacterium]|nr:HEAT repeat domain-containing protein [Gemmatimonadaceae bacterium]